MNSFVVVDFSPAVIMESRVETTVARRRQIIHESERLEAIEITGFF